MIFFKESYFISVINNFINLKSILFSNKTLDGILSFFRTTKNILLTLLSILLEIINHEKNPIKLYNPKLPICQIQVIFSYQNSNSLRKAFVSKILTF